MIFRWLPVFSAVSHAPRFIDVSSPYPTATWYWLRLRLAGPFVLSEVSRDGVAWTCLSAERLPVPAGPRHLLLGKVPYDGSRTEHTEAGGMGTVAFADVKAYAPAGQP